MSYNISFLENGTATGVIVGIQQNVPSFIPLMLLFEFIVIAVSGAYGNARKTGYTNLLQWCALSSLVTTVSAFFLGGIFVNSSDYVSYLPILITCVAVTVIFALALLLSKDD